MNIGRLITPEGIEINLEVSQLRDLTEYLRRQEINDALAAAAKLEALGFIDPEEYERTLQAAYFAREQKTLPAAA